MSDFEHMNMREQTAQTQTQQIDVGLRIYMSKVYNHMAIGLFATALEAYCGAA